MHDNILFVDNHLRLVGFLATIQFLTFFGEFGLDFVHGLECDVRLVTFALLFKPRMMSCHELVTLFETSLFNEHIDLDTHLFGS